MFEDKKRDELEALMAAWVGEVGQLNKAVQELPGVFQKSISAQKGAPSSLAWSPKFLIDGSRGSMR